MLFLVTEGRKLVCVNSNVCRSKVAQYENQSLIKIGGVNTAKDAEFYFGKRVAYVYKVGSDCDELWICLTVF